MSKARTKNVKAHGMELRRVDVWGLDVNGRRCVVAKRWAWVPRVPRACPTCGRS